MKSLVLLVYYRLRYCAKALKIQQPLVFALNLNDTTSTNVSLVDLFCMCLSSFLKVFEEGECDVCVMPFV